MASADFPGTEQHQRLLRAVVAYYADDERVLAVLVFGSLGRGDWDQYSDLDLDIVLADGIEIEVMHELERLSASFAAIDERAAVIVPQSADEGDIVLASLAQLSIRYHLLETTSPNILDSMRLLHGRIGEETIRAAGVANTRAKPDELEALCGRCLRALAAATVLGNLVALLAGALAFQINVQGISELAGQIGGHAARWASADHHVGVRRDVQGYGARRSGCHAA